VRVRASGSVCARKLGGNDGSTVRVKIIQRAMPHPTAVSGMNSLMKLLNKTPWPESASELYRPSDSRLSAKLLPNVADRWCQMVSVTDAYGRNLGFLDWSRYFSSFKQLLSCTHKVEWTSFQTHYFTENLLTPLIELGPLDLQPGTLTTRPQMRLVW
jgi:hypothetical protein